MDTTPVEGAELTAHEVLALLAERGRAISASTWSAYVARGTAPSPVRRIGRTPVWREDDITAWAASGRSAPSGHDIGSLRDSVVTALTDYGGEFDVDGIVTELRSGGCATVDDMGHDRFWAIVESRARPVSDLVDPAESFRAEVTESLLRDRPVSVPAVWQRGGVTVEIHGASRVNASWPQPLADITITVLGGDTVRVDGHGVPSWEALWSTVEPLVEDWEADVAGHRAAVGRAQALVDRRVSELDRARTALRVANRDLAKLLPTAE